MDENKSPFGINNSFDVVFDDSRDSLGKLVDHSNNLMKKLSLTEDFLSEGELSFISDSKESISFDSFTDCDELELLRSILEHNESPVIIVEKPQNESKANKIRSLLDNDFKLRVCYIECLEIFHFNHLFGSILNKLLRPDVDIDEQIEYQSDIAEAMDLNNFQTFTKKIDSNFKKIKCKDPIIVLDNADHLAKTNLDYVQYLIKINSLISGIKFTTVLISTLKLDHYKKLGLTFSEVYRIEFSPYSLDQIKDLIITNKPNNFSLSNYKRFDLNETITICLLNFFFLITVS